MTTIDTTSPLVRRHEKHFLDRIATRLGKTTFDISEARRHERPLLRWMTHRIGFWNTLLIHDTFTALGNGTNLDGWTPDTVNTPGNSWVEGVAGRNQGDGTGIVVRDTDFGTARIDTGVTNNIIRAEVSATLPTTKEGQLLVILASSTYISFVGGTMGLHGLELWHNASDDLMLTEVIDGVRTTLASVAFPRTIGVTYDYAVEFDGTDLKAYVDGSEVTALTQTSYSIPAELDGNSFAAVDGSAITHWDDFRVLINS